MAIFLSRYAGPMGLNRVMRGFTPRTFQSPETTAPPGLSCIRAQETGSYGDSTFEIPQWRNPSIYTLLLGWKSGE